jgi:hypothetical protein
MPDNSVFYYAAYVAAALVYGGYLVSLVIRRKRVLDRERRRGAGLAHSGRG